MHLKDRCAGGLQTHTTLPLMVLNVVPDRFSSGGPTRSVNSSWVWGLQMLFGSQACVPARSRMHTDTQTRIRMHGPRARTRGGEEGGGEKGGSEEVAKHLKIGGGRLGTFLLFSHSRIGTEFEAAPPAV